ncbi:MAG: addiction module protein [Gallionellaceae bacterium]
MLAQLAELQTQAKQLGTEARAYSGDVSQAWKAEIKARWAEIERGDVQPILAAEVFADIRRKLQ